MVSEIGLASDLAVVLLAAAAMAFLAKRTGQPTIIAYILTGIILGPAVLDVVTPGTLIDTVAELGLAFLLFLLGIKMRLGEIRHVLEPIVRISLPQMTLVALAGFLTALALGFDLGVAVLVGLAVMYSSTAVVIKMLTDKNEATSLHGKIDVGVLLVQDIVVVIILAVLAAGEPESLVDIGGTLAVVLVLVALVGAAAIGASQYLLPGLFRRIADNKDVFFLVAIAWAFLYPRLGRDRHHRLAARYRDGVSLDRDGGLSCRYRRRTVAVQPRTAGPGQPPDRSLRDGVFRLGRARPGS